MDWIRPRIETKRALVDMVMSLRVPKNVGKFLVVAKQATSQEGLSSIELISLTVLEFFEEQ
jgi:hypothetical protein